MGAGDNPVNAGDPSGLLACSLGSDTVPPWTAGLVQLANASGAGNERCAQQMAVNWVWHNTLQGVLSPTTVLNRNDQTELADQITASSISATIAIWFTYPSVCSVDGANVNCLHSAWGSYPTWMEGIGAAYLEMEPTAWYSWQADVYIAQFMWDWNATIVESLIQTVAVGEASPWIGQEVVNDVISEIFNYASYGPSAPISAGSNNAYIRSATMSSLSANSDGQTRTAEGGASSRYAQTTQEVLKAMDKVTSRCYG